MTVDTARMGMGGDPPIPAAVWEQYSTPRRWGLLAVLFLVSASNYVDRHVMSVLLEPIKREFHASDAQMGLLNGFAFAACYAILGVPVARLSDRGDRRLVIALSMAVWSVTTVMCGLAAVFPLLLLARIGVGVGEAGAIPPAQSLIADYVAPERRARALGVFLVSATVGYLIAFTAGASLAAAYGWRTSVIALGAPGVLLAAIAWLALDEPRLRVAATVRPAQEPLASTVKALAAKASYVWVTISMIIYFLVAYGAVTWFPAYLVRVLHVDLVTVGAAFGALSAAAALVGTLAGGWLTDRLARPDRRWLAWTPAIILAAAAPVYMVAMTVRSLPVFLTLVSAGGTALSASVPAMFVLLHAVCGSARRGMAVAIALFFANLVGLGFGPLITGMLSDYFTARQGPAGLATALTIAFTLLVICAAALARSARTLRADIEV